MNWNILLISFIIYTLVFINGNLAKNVQKRGVMDNLNDGLKKAGQMFGINTAADVANLVAKAFSNNNRNKPDIFSIIQKGLQTPAFSHSSEERKYSEKQQSYESSENEQQQPEESTQFKQFQTKSTSPPANENVGVNFSTSNLITSMLRMVGFDASKLGALAINALIMIASAIGNTLMGAATKSPTLVSSVDGGQLFHNNPTQSAPSERDNIGNDNAETGPEEKYSPNDHQPRMIKDDSLIDWFLNNPSIKMKRILKDATNTNLADKLTNMIENYENEVGQGACLKMLVCKSSPFIWGMQKSIKNRIESNGKDEESPSTSEDLNENSENRLFNVQHFFTHLPSINEYRKHGETCEKLYSNYCNTSDLYNKKR